MSQTVEFSSFSGLDLRKHAAATPPNALRRAINVNLKLAGGLECRDGLTFLCNVSPYSVGLYPANGALHAVVPGGQAITDVQPPEVVYDVIGDGTIYPVDAIKRLHGIELIGSASQVGAKPYVSIERTDGTIEHHYCIANPATSVSAVNTRVTLPFDPGKILIKSNSKLFTDDPSNGVLRYSSTLNGPTDWSAARDAGFLAIKQFISGPRDLAGVGYYRGKVAVQFKDATQIWTMDPDPAKFQLESVMNGPGTDMPTANANILGDLMYFSRGEFRRLSPKPYTSEIEEIDIGAYIAPLTRLIDTSSVRMLGIWSQARQQFLCTAGSVVYCFTYSPVNKLQGWTTWQLPVSVDNVCEMNGDIFLRAGTAIYKLDKTATMDSGTTPIAFDVLTAYLTMRRPGTLKRWQWFDLLQQGTAAANFQIDPDRETAEIFRVPVNLTGTTLLDGHVGVNVIANTLALHLTGVGPWSLDSFLLTFDMLNGGG